MNIHYLKQTRLARRKMRVRKRVTGTSDRPRLSVFRSLKHTYAQIIDDVAGRTLVAASTKEAKPAKTSNKQAAATVGKLLAQKAVAAGISLVCFDRNGLRYHGRIKALADAAREAGLKF
ncbi:MAG: 50S ribosomal protein L18 [Phycisphaeraceae bacterium]|nr:50S ribosomal protein L18 [Phycisphaeraceae bacterium]